MEFENKSKKRVVRFKSVTNSYNKKLFKIERCNSNSKLSSLSKKTGCFGFEENTGGITKMNSFPTKISSNNLCFQIQNNLNIHSSVDLSMRDIKARHDINNIYANINISIDNPNFSINNIENNNKTSSVYGTNKLKKKINNKDSSVDLNNPTFISFKGSNIESDSNNSQEDKDRKVISSIYADYLANKSNSDILSENVRNESKIKIFNEYLEKNKILQYEYKKGCISGFSGYTYQNEENINKNKLCINININKRENNNKNGKIHFINFFSLFCGDNKDENDDLSKFLKNNFKDIILNDKEILSNTTNALKNSFIKCELKYINNFLKERKENKNLKINNCSIIIILNIDDFFYVATVGNIISIISSNLSKKIEYLSKENISQEEYENHIKKKRKSLYTNLNCSINFSNELNNSKECFKNTINNTNQNENKDILNIININTIFSYEFIRVFPGKKLNDIIIGEYNNISKNINKNSNKKIFNRRATAFTPTNGNVIINNFIKKNNDDLVKRRRASLGPFFKISPKSKNYNPTKNYRKSCAQSNSNDKTQIIQIISSYPDIISFKYKIDKHDFIFIGNEIIFKKISNDKICKVVYDTMKKCIKKHRSFELFIGWVIKDIIKMCVSLGIKNNISCLFICFNSLKKLYLKENIDEIKNVLVPLCLTYTNKNNYGFYDDLLSFNFIDVDKANNYNEIIEKHIDKIYKSDSQLFEIIEENEDKKKTKYNNNIFGENENNINKNRNKKGKKKCCCFF